jgi:hypothetical protein
MHIHHQRSLCRDNTNRVRIHYSRLLAQPIWIFIFIIVVVELHWCLLKILDQASWQTELLELRLHLGARDGPLGLSRHNKLGHNST